MSAEFERIASPELAIQRFLNYSNAKGLVVKYLTVGTRLQTTTCDLIGPSRRRVVGRGKGIGLQSVASAVFEAFEHYHHQYESIYSKLHSVTFDASSLNEDLRCGSPDFALIFGRKPARLSCLTFRGIDDRSEPISFPAILMNPAFEPVNSEEHELLERTRLYRYSTNSGTAAGLSTEEAILHGLLEIIERDSVGLALIGAVLSPAPIQVRIIDPDSLPERCKWIASAAIQETGGKIKIWDITSDVGIPSALCALTIGEPPVYRFFGSGASLSTEYAIERAMLEVMQGYHIQMSLRVTIQSPLERNIDRMSLYQRCQLSAGYFEYRGGEIEIDFNEIRNVNAKPLDLRAQIGLIVSTLAAKGIKTYYRIVHEDVLFVTQVVAPRLERMYLISHGIPLAPGDRGRAARRLPEVSCLSSRAE